MRSRIYVIAFLLLSPGLVLAQQSHSHAPIEVIDGSKEPERISDIAAFRLWLEATTPQPQATPEQIAVQKLHANRAVDVSGLPTFFRLTSEFRTQFESLVSEYNSRPHNDSSEWPEFEARLDQLAADTMERFKAELGEAAYRRLVAYIRSEKAHMRLAVRQTGGEQ